MITHRPRLPAALVAANALGVGVAAVYAAAGMRTAWRTAGPVTRSEATYWATASAMRAAAVAVPVAFGLLRDAPPPGLLVSAGVVQLGDALVGVARRNPMMTTLPTLMGVVHLTTAALIRRSTP